MGRYRRKHQHVEHQPPGCGLKLNRTNAAYYGQRGGVAVPTPTYFVEGEWLTYEQMGARLGLASETVAERYRYAKKLHHPVKWEHLERGRHARTTAVCAD